MKNMIVNTQCMQSVQWLFTILSLFDNTVTDIVFLYRDPSLKAHTKFLESLGIAGISHHSLLFSRTAPVPVVEEEELTR